MKFSSKIPPNIIPGTLLSQYLAIRFTYHSISDWERIILEGKVVIDGKLADIDSKITPGTIIEYDAGEFQEPPADLNYSIVYEDQWILGVNKPANLLVHRAGASFRNNLIYQLRYVHQPLYPNAHTIHRLDRDTSGVLLVAKNSEIHAVMGKIFADGEIEKKYVAIVKGLPDKELKRMEFPIAKKLSSAIDYKFHVDPQGKPAVTLISNCRPLGSSFAMVDLMPLTGRTHQIRVHLAYCGYPIVGDKLYGLSDDEYLRWRDKPTEYKPVLPFGRHALHCKSVSFKHPYLSKEVTIEAPLPEDMRKLVVELSEGKKKAGI